MRNKSIKIRKRLESSSSIVLLLCGAISVFSVILITIFILQQGLPTFKDVSLKEFLFSTNWSPSAEVPHYGIASFVIASIEVTLLSMLFALPIALSSAIYLSEFASGRFAKILRSGIELLAGIPSIIYGLFGIAVVVPLVRTFIGGNGYSLLSASIILAIMILPTIINFSEVSIKAVPDELKAASIAMGATEWQTLYRVTIPASLSGIVSSIILALGRAIGETTAVVLVGGNAPIFTTNPLEMGRTLTMNIITDMSYAEGTHMSALFATAMLLFIFILILNLIVVAIMRKERLDG
jgi:phosphate transport system permease protein